MIQDNFNGIQENFEWWFKGASNWFKEVSKRFKESVKCVSRKFHKKFQESFNEVLFCNFVLAWISSQLPEQKEGLLSNN